MEKIQIRLINGEHEIVRENKKQNEIDIIKQSIEEAKQKNKELEKLLEESKERLNKSIQDIDSAHNTNLKLIEQKNILQMRVDALIKKKKDDELRKEQEIKKQKVDNETKDAKSGMHTKDTSHKKDAKNESKGKSGKD